MILISSTGNKVPFVVSANERATDSGINANSLVKIIGQLVNGRGGGKPDMAQGSGSDSTRISQALDAVLDDLKKQG